MYQFSNFNRAEIGPPRLPSLHDGFEGVLRVEKTYVNDTRFGAKFFCEMTVMTSNLVQNPPGQLVVWKQDLTKKDVADNAMLQWAAGCLGVQREDTPNVEALKQAMQGLLHYAVNVNQEVNNFTHAMSQKYVCAKARATTTKQERAFIAVDFFPYVSNGA